MPAAAEHKPLRFMLVLVSTVAGVYLLVCGAVFLLQRRLVFFPGPAPRVDPAAVGLVFDEHWLTTADGRRLHAWWIRTAVEPGPAGAVIVCHGNAGSIGDRLHLARMFTGMGLDVLLFD